MNDKTRLIDLNVGQLKTLLAGFNVEPKEKTIYNPQNSSFEKDLIEEYFVTIKHNYPGELLTATQIKTYIEEKSGRQITNMKLFGRELKAFFGKSIQKRGIGFVYWTTKRF